MMPDNFAMLAAMGGEPVRRTPLGAWPHFDEELVEAAGRVLRSGRVNYWTGDEGRQFEREYASLLGAKHAVAVANGTLALELALQALQIGPGDEVIVTSRTFLASASSIVIRGATPVFADVDPVSQNITAETIQDALTARTRAIIAVHLAGWPCDMDPIMELANRHDLRVIEDCAQAHGGKYQGRPLGSIGHAAAFSFCQDKILSTGGEGGMLVTNDENVWKRAWSYKDHGKSWDTVYHKQHPPGYRWLHESIGTNWRMTEMQSAIGRVLLKRLPLWVERRRAIARDLNDCCGRIPALRVTLPGDEIYHSYYKYYVFLQPDCLQSGWDRERIIEAIIAEGIPCFSGSCSEVYLEAAFPPELRPARPLQVARRLGETSLMFLVHPTLSGQEVLDTRRAIEKVLDAASGERRAAA